MGTATQNIIRQSLSKPDNTNYTPLFFRTSDNQEKERLNALIATNHCIKLYDTITEQLAELIRSRSPQITFGQAALEKEVEKYLSGRSMEDYGVWVFYPWSERLVHILDEQEFVELRTNRNKYKITDEERLILASKKVGVIGLSVGQSVSLTMAMERTFGELRIADHDELDITNLNRLRSGIFNIGVKKTVLVAREIAEIDPFLKVRCFHKGITEGNMEMFLLDGGKLDMLIEECDSVDIKVSSRLAARKHGIPVLMEASDRGTVDVERFDLQPDRPILHGFVDHLDLSKLKGLKTNEEKLPYILPFVGVETMSARLKASAIEVGQTISTWPQLASAVALGGGVTADVCRRILLGQFHQSGRYFVDVEQLIADPAQKKLSKKHETNIMPLTEDQMQGYASTIAPVAPNEAVVDVDMVRTLVIAAQCAPSAGNNQPWKWYFDGARLFLFHDVARTISFGDFTDMASGLSFGAAIENLKLKASELGIAVSTDLFPFSNDPIRLIAIFTFARTNQESKDELAAYIEIRHTNRNIGTREKIDLQFVEEMKAAVANKKGVRFLYTDNAEEISHLADITGKAEKLRMFIEEGHYEFFEKELRWGTGTDYAKEGLDVRTLDLNAKNEIGLRLLRDKAVVELIKEWKGGSALELMTRDLVASASGIGLVTASAFDSSHFIESGSVAERIWLSATKNNIEVQPVLAPILHFARMMHDRTEEMPAAIRQEFEKLHEEFLKAWNISATDEPMFLFRFCFAEKPAVRSLRLDLDDIFFHTPAIVAR